MPFLPPNQQRQSTEGKIGVSDLGQKHTLATLGHCWSSMQMFNGRFSRTAYLTIHYATFMGTTMTIKGRLQGRVLPLGNFRLVTLGCDLDLCHFDLGQCSSIVDHMIYPSTKSEDATLSRSWLMTHSVSHRNALGATVHALYHVTSEQGVKNQYIIGIPNRYFPLHYASFMWLWWRLRVVYRGEFYY